jgi:hypothetical protein
VAHFAKTCSISILFIFSFARAPFSLLISIDSVPNESASSATLSIEKERNKRLSSHRVDLSGLEKKEMKFKNKDMKNSISSPRLDLKEDNNIESPLSNNNNNINNSSPDDITNESFTESSLNDSNLDDYNNISESSESLSSPTPNKQLKLRSSRSTNKAPSDRPTLVDRRGTQSLADLHVKMK